MLLLLLGQLVLPELRVRLGQQVPRAQQAQQEPRVRRILFLSELSLTAQPQPQRLPEQRRHRHLTLRFQQARRERRGLRGQQGLLDRQVRKEIQVTQDHKDQRVPLELRAQLALRALKVILEILALRALLVLLEPLGLLALRGRRALKAIPATLVLQDLLALLGLQALRATRVILARRAQLVQRALLEPLVLRVRLARLALLALLALPAQE